MPESIGNDEGVRASRRRAVVFVGAIARMLLPPAMSVRNAGFSRAALDGVLAVSALSAGFLWSYAPTLAGMAERWSRDPQYSHGFLVPVFAAALLWSRRRLLDGSTAKPNRAGLLLLALAVALRLVAASAGLEGLDAFTLLPALAGVVLLVGGVGWLRWSWPAIAFLGFMLPLPYFAEVSLAFPLRRMATVVSTYALQTLGCPAVAEGNIILVEDIRLGVAEACSGLGMLMTFFALATALALVIDAPLHDRLIVVASAAPIAVLANVARITATGLAYHAWGAGSPAAHAIMHDLAGWLMMPFALVLLWLELRFLSRLFVEEHDRSLQTVQPSLLGHQPVSAVSTSVRPVQAPLK